jgi:hypothetical protein
VSQTPETITATIRGLRSSISKRLDTKGLTLRACGIDTTYNQLKPFDNAVGYWRNPADVNSKPPRWVLQILPEVGNVIVRVAPGVAGANRIGYFNTTSADVGGILVRIIPAIRRSDQSYDLHHAWEWALFFGFAKPLPKGTSADIVDFDSTTGSLRFKEQPQPYVTAMLFALCDPGDEYQWGPAADQKLPYGPATQALSRLFRIAPTSHGLQQPAAAS